MNALAGLGLVLAALGIQRIGYRPIRGKEWCVYDENDVRFDSKEGYILVPPLACFTYFQDAYTNPLDGKRGYTMSQDSVECYLLDGGVTAGGTAFFDPRLKRPDGLRIGQVVKDDFDPYWRDPYQDWPCIRVTPRLVAQRQRFKQP